MSQVIDLQAFKQAKLSNAVAVPPTYIYKPAQVPVGLAGRDGDDPLTRVRFTFDDAGPIPASVFVQVMEGVLPLNALPEHVVRLVLGMWARDRLQLWKEKGV